MPSTDKLSPARVARSGLCIGCGACAATSPGTIAMQLDGFGQYKPHGPGRKQATRELAAVCPFSPTARDEDEIAAERFPAPRTRDPHVGSFEAAYVGAASEGEFRSSGSSGGMVSWVASELLRQGLVDGVAHVVPTWPSPPLFDYRISRSMTEVRHGAKSRYYPAELSRVLREIQDVPGRYAIVGVPCFIKAIHLLRDNDPVLRERIVYTLGLFCGHMKSARFAESLAWQLKAPFEQVRKLDFRAKDPGRPANWYRSEFQLDTGERRADDWWNLVDGDWGAGFFQNSACNFCDDVVAETADISFGDAWVEPYASDGRGTNVVVVRDRTLHRLLEQGMAESRVELSPVDANFVVATQQAGFRQRREGLALRLARRRWGLRPRKRVAATASGLPLRRRMVYRQRERIARWSHRVFWLARTLGAPRLYLTWASASLAWYQATTYSRGRLGRLLDTVLGTRQR